MNTAEILELIENKSFARVKEVMAVMNNADIADVFDALDSATASIVFRLLNKDKAAEVFAYLESDTQRTLTESLSDKEIAHIVGELFLDDAVDFLEEMPASVVARVLQNTDEKTRKEINQLLQYDENSAGSLMTPEFIDLKESLTAAQAISVIRRKAVDKETIYTCYVKDAERRLVGVVTVRQLFNAGRDKLVSEIMETNVISVHTHDDREEIVRIFKKYGFTALPVVDKEDRIVGIVTIDDAMDVLEEEATEDFHKMAAMKPSEQPYLKTKPFVLARNRFVWLFILMVAGLLTGGIIEIFDTKIGALPILASFIPLLMSTGGNAGSQSSTLIIRGMATGDIETRDFKRVVWKEIRVALVIIPFIALFVFARVMLMVSPEKLPGIDYGKLKLAVSVACSISFTLLSANLIGVMLPMLAKKIKVDPAVMASPVLTTIIDTLSLVIYFLFLTLFLGLS